MHGTCDPKKRKKEGSRGQGGGEKERERKEGKKEEKAQPEPQQPVHFLGFCHLQCVIQSGPGRRLRSPSVTEVQWRGRQPLAEGSH